MPAPRSALDRPAAARRLDEAYDVVVVGGGATGTGAALDAVVRGYSTLLVEAADFAAATSSRSTKLVHGGVRYLQQGNVSLVREALAERARLLANAPHLACELSFLLPAYHGWELPYYAAGLAAYDLLAGWANLRRSGPLGRRATLARVPGLRPDGLVGSIRYSDAQFDDARLALALARTAAERGATVINHCRLERLTRTGSRIDGALLRDLESGREHRVRARVVVNATGIFADALRAEDDATAVPVLAHSRGSHLVVPRDVLGGDEALIVPRTSDGRVLFAIPWYGHVLVGTTDVPASAAELDPRATPEEIAYLLETVGRYLARPARPEDVLATFAGLRPLVGAGAVATSKLSREHLVLTSESGLVTVTGGKWTTYRTMAADTIDAAARAGRLAAAPCRTAELPLHGAAGGERVRLNEAAPDPDAVYGTDAAALAGIEAARPESRRLLDRRLPYRESHAVLAIRDEMARTVDDVLARRTRARFLDAAAAEACEPRVAELLAEAAAGT